MKQLFHKPQSCERNKYDAELCIVPAFFNFPFSDLKESGALEADGDYILLIHRPYVLNKGSRDISEHTTEVLVDKNKFGSTGKVDFYFDGQYQQFREIDKRFEGMHMTSEPVPRSFCGNAKEAEQ